MIINNIANINFGGGGGSDIKVQDMKIVTQDVNSSGLYDFQPDEGYDAMKAVKANLTIPSTPVQSIDLKTGIKFAYSSFSAVPFTLICDSGVTEMTNMFYNCSNLITLDANNFDTSQVTTMGNMFNNCSNLITLDVSNFNTSKVSNISRMFRYCGKLTTVKVTNCDESTKNKIVTQLQTDMSSYTWTLGDDGIIRRSEKTA